MTIKTCKECKKEFKAYRKDAEYCKPKCKKEWWKKNSPKSPFRES